MADTEYEEFLQLARDTTVAMLENVQYMKQELPHVELPDELKRKMEEACEHLVVTKDNVLSTILAIDDVQEDPVSAGEKTAMGERLLGQLFDPLAKLHPTIEALQELSQQDSRYTLAFMLVSESATNILKNFVQAKELFETWSENPESTD